MSIDGLIGDGLLINELANNDFYEEPEYYEYPECDNDDDEEEAKDGLFLDRDLLFFFV